MAADDIILRINRQRQRPLQESLLRHNMYISWSKVGGIGNNTTVIEDDTTVFDPYRHPLRTLLSVKRQCNFLFFAMDNAIIHLFCTRSTFLDTSVGESGNTTRQNLITETV